MAAKFGWTEQDDRRLRSLVARGTLFHTEIATELGRRPASVSWRIKKLKLPSSRVYLLDRFGKWNQKHAHLRGPAMRYFQTHSATETAEHFGLTQTEFKSLLTVAYRDPHFKRLRKCKRDRTAWSAKQLKFLLQHAGLRPRTWIAERIGRGNVTCIKERLQALGLASRNMQGLTLSQFKTAFGHYPSFFLQTDAGPNGGDKQGMPTRWKIVPWVWLDEEIRSLRLKTVPELKMLITARAQFQQWIFGGNALSKMKRIVRDAHTGKGVRNAR